MTQFTVRRLLIDLQTPFARHWCDGDPFRTALFNALSMSFPVGEQFFIDSLRSGAAALPPDKVDSFREEMAGFIGQEATHRHIHALFNGHLARQGLVNGMESRIVRRLRRIDGLPAHHHVSLTAAYEHFTAILAEWLLRHPDVFGTTEARLQTLWLWHSAEESEHRSTAFDLHLALGGTHRWRVRWFLSATVFFLCDVALQTSSNLWRDGTLWHATRWAGAARHLFGRGGLLRANAGPWSSYVRRDFHPRQADSSLSADWLAANAEQLKPVR